MEYENRTYRSLINKDNLVSYNVKISESDLLISSDVPLADEAFKSLAKHRNSLESYIKNHPEFQKSLTPIADDDLAPSIVREMLLKSKICGVGPMAGVAGAVSEFVGRDLLGLTENIIIENGGDIFLRSSKKLITSVFAGESPLSYNINFIVKPEETPVGICTSSGRVGPSLSFGKADAVCVLSPSAALADAAASAIGNQVQSSQDIRKALDYGITISGITGIIIICGKDMGAIGEVELV
jgi:hypothetical protein